MTNPWEAIPLSDYETHMSLDSIRQLQTMDAIMQEQFSEYPSETVMLLGIAGGNGLRHVDPAEIQTLYGVDVNRDYLAACAARYPALGNTLVCIQADLTAPALMLPQARLVIANLLVEYTGYECFRKVLKSVRPQYVSCAIQINSGEGFVSNSPYLHVFDGLEAVYHQIDGDGLAKALALDGFHLTETKEYMLPNAKKIARMDFRSGRPP